MIVDVPVPTTPTAGGETGGGATGFVTVVGTGLVTGVGTGFVGGGIVVPGG